MFCAINRSPCLWRTLSRHFRCQLRNARRNWQLHLICRAPLSAAPFGDPDQIAHLLCCCSGRRTIGALHSLVASLAKSSREALFREELLCIHSLSMAKETVTPWAALSSSFAEKHVVPTAPSSLVRRRQLFPTVWHLRRALLDACELILRSNLFQNLHFILFILPSDRRFIFAQTVYSFSSSLQIKIETIIEIFILFLDSPGSREPVY